MKWEFEREKPYLEGMGRRSKRENAALRTQECQPFHAQMGIGRSKEDTGAGGGLCSF